MGVKPPVHFPRPHEVVERVVHVCPVTIFGGDFVEPHLVDLKRATVVTVKVWMAIDDVLAS